MFAGYKTVLTGVLSMVAGLATAMGVGLDADTLKSISDNTEVIVGAGMTLYGGVMVLLRAFTSSPMFKKPE